MLLMGRIALIVPTESAAMPQVSVEVAISASTRCQHRDPGIDPEYPDPGPNGYNGQLQCGVYKPTNVFSLSYGGQEADVPIAYQKRQCNEYLKLGLQGISFLFASGDAGVGNYPEPYGNGCLGPGKKIFSPTWPNNCPWVTNVGATKVYPGKTVYDPEMAVFDPVGHPYHVNFSSGGGFSNIYPVPNYQKAAVSTYLIEHTPPYKFYSGLVANAPNPVKPDIVALAGDSGGIYNSMGRGIPDVSIKLFTAEEKLMLMIENR